MDSGGDGYRRGRDGGALETYKTTKQKQSESQEIGPNKKLFIE